MAAAFQSSTSGIHDAVGGTLSISAPASIAVGDLLIAYVCSIDYDTNANSDVNTPSGWTLMQKSANLGPGSPGNRITFASFKKIADASDAAASTFAFTSTNSNARMRGRLIRFNDNDDIDATVINTSNTGSKSNTAHTNPSNTGITQTDKCLLLILVGGNSSSARSVSGYAVATSNPSWTEIFDDTGVLSSDRIVMAGATGQRNVLTATGTASATFSGNEDNSDLQIIAIAARIVKPAPASALFGFVRPIVPVVIASIPFAVFGFITPTFEAIGKKWRNKARVRNTAWDNTPRN